MKKETVSNVLLVCAGLFLLLAIIFASVGFHKITAYENSDSIWDSHVNAYVGGDAYNYIINGTYFAGYCSFGGALLVCAVISAVSGLYFRGKVDEEQEKSERRKAEVGSSTPAPIAPVSAAVSRAEVKPPIAVSGGRSSDKPIAPAALDDNEIICPTCGRRQTKGRRWCFQCGTLLDASILSNT